MFFSTGPSLPKLEGLWMPGLFHFPGGLPKAIPSNEHMEHRKPRNASHPRAGPAWECQSCGGDARIMVSFLQLLGCLNIKPTVALDSQLEKAHKLTPGYDMMILWSLSMRYNYNSEHKQVLLFKYKYLVLKYIYIYIYILYYISTYISYIFTYLRLHIYLYISTYISLHIYIYIFTYLHIYLYISTYISLHIYI